MRRSCFGLVLAVLVSACGSGQAEEGDVDDRPPPFRDHDARVVWSTDDPDPPTDDWILDISVEFRLSILLMPSNPPGGAVWEVSLDIRNVGFGRFVLVGTNSAETSSWLRVTSTNQTGIVECGPAGVLMMIRGTESCFGSEGPRKFILSWREEWVHQPRWTQDAVTPPDQHFDFILAWLDK